MTVTIDLSSATVQRVFLSPGMDARALNVEQQRILFDDSPEPDSLIELLQAIDPDTKAEARAFRQLIHGAVELYRSNGSEGEFELAICGAADQLARDLHDEVQNHGREQMVVKAIARKLRPALATIAKPPVGEPRSLVAAGRAIGEVTSQVPTDQLLSPGLRHELGAGRYELLCSLIEQKGEAAAVPAASQNHGGNP